MGDEFRNDINLRHFRSRSQQPRLAVNKSVAQKMESRGRAPVDNSVVYDQGFGGVSHEIDDSRFIYVGTYPRYNKYEMMQGRSRGQNLMRDSFY